MPVTLNDTLVIGITATALFELSEADNVFRENFAVDRENAVKVYREYMLEREDVVLEDGTGMQLVTALLELNKYQKDESAPLIEVVIMSRNSPETCVRVLNSIRNKGLKISRHAFTGGESVVDYLEAYDVDLFLTTSNRDAQKVSDGRNCAVAVVKNPPTTKSEIPEGQVRIAFDGDAVLFDEESELVYKTQGLKKFQTIEEKEQNTPLTDGPYATLLRKLAKLQEKLPFSVEFSPVRIAIVTARNAPAEMRVIKTLRHWGVYVDEVFFLGGLEKSKVLKAFRPHIFFDDQDLHLEAAAKLVPSGKVPYRTESPLNQLIPPTDKDYELVQPGYMSLSKR